MKTLTALKRLVLRTPHDHYLLKEAIKVGVPIGLVMPFMPAIIQGLFWVLFFSVIFFVLPLILHRQRRG